MSKLTANQQKWVDALRSGAFRQATGLLNDGSRYCCLGVGCVLAERDGVYVSRHSDGRISGGTLLGQQPVMQWLGLRTPLGESTNGYRLSRLNDEGKTFSELADIIEAYADELFVATAEGEP